MRLHLLRFPNELARIVPPSHQIPRSRGVVHFDYCHSVQFLLLLGGRRGQEVFVGEGVAVTAQDDGAGIYLPHLPHQVISGGCCCWQDSCLQQQQGVLLLLWAGVLLSTPRQSTNTVLCVCRRGRKSLLPTPPFFVCRM